MKLGRRYNEANKNIFLAKKENIDEAFVFRQPTIYRKCRKKILKTILKTRSQICRGKTLSFNTTSAQCCKNFYGRNLGYFVMRQSVLSLTQSNVCG
jgi:hypothetical protein